MSAENIAGPMTLENYLARTGNRLADFDTQKRLGQLTDQTLDNLLDSGLDPENFPYSYGVLKEAANRVFVLTARNMAGGVGVATAEKLMDNLQTGAETDCKLPTFVMKKIMDNHGYSTIIRFVPESPHPDLFWFPDKEGVKKVNFMGDQLGGEDNVIISSISADMALTLKRTAGVQSDLLAAMRFGDLFQANHLVLKDPNLTSGERLELIEAGIKKLQAEFGNNLLQVRYMRQRWQL